jgi:hypothetical protein
LRQRGNRGSSVQQKASDMANDLKWLKSGTIMADDLSVGSVKSTNIQIKPCFQNWNGVTTGDGINGPNVEIQGVQFGSLDEAVGWLRKKD